MTTTDELVVLLNQTIPPIQKQLAEQDRITRLTVEEMMALLTVEQAHKNRRGVVEWLQLGIATGRPVQDGA